MKPTPQYPRAICVIARDICDVSAPSDLRNFLRAGTLKNRSRTSTVVPSRIPVSVTTGSPPPSTRTSTPWLVPDERVRSRRCDTEATLGNASPRNPSVAMAFRSSRRPTLLVACLSIASNASSDDIPIPSSSTRIRRFPPNSTVTMILRLPASIEFSMSSLTTDAGRSTTSPAAI